MNDLVPMNDMQTMAAAIAKSGLFGAKTPDQALALMLVAQAEGLHPASAARDYDIIQGKGSKKSEAMLRDFLKAGGTVKWHTLDDTNADATFSHQAGGEVRITWDMKRAERAGLNGKDMYKKFPRQMLRARCVSEGVRTVCPMATGGMYTPEEVADIPEKDVTAEGQTLVIDQPKPKSAAEPKPKTTTIDQATGEITETQGEQKYKGSPATDGMKRTVKAALTNAALSEVDMKARFGFGLDDMPRDACNDVMAWSKDPVPAT